MEEIIKREQATELHYYPLSLLEQTTPPWIDAQFYKYASEGFRFYTSSWLKRVMVELKMRI